MARGSLSRLAIPALVAVTLTSAGAAPPPRAAAARAEFQRQQPCPATSRPRGACPGWQVDHIRPLCDGGLDHPSNMQWLTVAEHKIKTRSDAKACRLKVPSPISD